MQSIQLKKVLSFIRNKVRPLGPTGARLQLEIKEQVEDEILLASVIMEMRTAVEESEAEYARGYLDGMALALRWRAAQEETFERNHPEIVSRLSKTL